MTTIALIAGHLGLFLMGSIFVFVLIALKCDIKNTAERLAVILIFALCLIGCLRMIEYGFTH